MTAFEITKEVAELDDWTETEIKDRHTGLKKEALKILGRFDAFDGLLMNKIACSRCSNSQNGAL